MVEDYSERPTESTPEEKRVAHIPVARSPTAIDPSETYTYENKKNVFRWYHLIWFIVSVIDILLAFRFFFELTAANPYNSFVQFIYAFSYPFAQPFHNIFGVSAVSYATFDWSLLVAIVVYLLIGYGLIQLLKIARPVTTDEAQHHRVGHV